MAVASCWSAKGTVTGAPAAPGVQNNSHSWSPTGTWNARSRVTVCPGAKCQHGQADNASQCTHEIPCDAGISFALGQERAEHAPQHTATNVEHPEPEPKPGGQGEQH